MSAGLDIISSFLITLGLYHIIVNRDRLQKEKMFLKQFNTKIGFFYNIKVVESSLKSYIENENFFFSIEKHGIKHFYPSPNADDIIDKLIYKDTEFSESKIIDSPLENSLIPYLLERIRSDQNYFISFLESVLKSEYNSAPLNQFVIRELFISKSFVNETENIFKSLDKKLLSTLKIKDKNSIIKLINDENNILKMRNSMEHDKLFKKILAFLFKNYEESFLEEINIIIQKTTFENHLYFLLFDILSYLRLKVEYYIFNNDNIDFANQNYDFKHSIQDCKIFNEMSKNIKQGKCGKYTETMIDLIRYD